MYVNDIMHVSVRVSKCRYVRIYSVQLFLYLYLEKVIGCLWYYIIIIMFIDV